MPLERAGTGASRLATPGDSSYVSYVTAKLQAIYENGMLKLQHPLPLPDQAAVTVTVESDSQPASDADRAAWLELSKRRLSQVWDNPADDVFNELLQETQL